MLLNILFIIGNLEGGGAQKLIADGAPFLKKNNKCEVLVLSKTDDKYSDYLRKNHVKCFFLDDITSSHLGRLKGIIDYIKHGKYDVVHVHLFPALYYCAFIKLFMFKNIPFVFTEHNTDNRRRHIKILRPIEKIVYKQYNSVVSISKDTKKELLKWINPINKSKYFVIENGVPIDVFSNAMPLNRKDIYQGLLMDDILLCMIGSFTTQKNHRFAIEVLKDLPEQFKLALVGEGPLEEEIKKLVEEKQLSRRCFFLGFRKDVGRIMKTSDIVIIPSLWEGFGLVAIEAFASGKPVVCSNVPGLSDVVGNVGIKVPVNDKAAFVKRLLEIQNKDINREKYIKRAKKYDIKVMLKKYYSLYKSNIESIKHKRV